MNPIIFWAVILVVLLGVEMATMNLTTIWFALGAVGALISAAAAPTAELFWLQLLIFLLISCVTMYYTRPLAKRYVNAKRTPTNANRVLEMTGVVREEIDNVDGKGTVYVGGKLWTARSEDGQTVPLDTQVEILRIEGNKLIVLPIQTGEPEAVAAAASETSEGS